jgi:hypothetical protein
MRKPNKSCRFQMGYTVEAMIAVGKPGQKEDLPEQLRGQGVPSDRKSLSAIVFEGKFPV